MTVMRFFVVLIFLSFCSMFAGCGGGSSSSPSAGGSSSGDAGTVNPGVIGSNGDSSATADLAWDAPTTNADGTLLADLAGYKIYYGNASGSYSEAVTVGAVTNYVLTDLAPGTYYIAVTAYNSAGAESDYSNEVTKTVL